MWSVTGEEKEGSPIIGADLWGGGSVMDSIQKKKTGERDIGGGHISGGNIVGKTIRGGAKYCAGKHKCDC